MISKGEGKWRGDHNWTEVEVQIEFSHYNKKGQKPAEGSDAGKPILMSERWGIIVISVRK